MFSKASTHQCGLGGLGRCVVFPDDVAILGGGVVVPRLGGVGVGVGGGSLQRDPITVVAVGGRSGGSVALIGAGGGVGLH